MFFQTRHEWVRTMAAPSQNHFPPILRYLKKTDKYSREYLESKNTVSSDSASQRIFQPRPQKINYRQSEPLCHLGCSQIKVSKKEGKQKRRASLTFARKISQKLIRKISIFLGNTCLIIFELFVIMQNEIGNFKIFKTN